MEGKFGIGVYNVRERELKDFRLSVPFFKINLIYLRKAFLVFVKFVS